MGSPELAQYADFYADTTRRFGLTDDLELWRDISERLHQLTSEPEDVTYRDVTANGVPAILVMPTESSPDHILLHSHSGGGVTASMWQERKAVGQERIHRHERERRQDAEPRPAARIQRFHAGWYRDRHNRSADQLGLRGSGGAAADDDLLRRVRDPRRRCQRVRQAGPCGRRRPGAPLAARGAAQLLPGRRARSGDRRGSRRGGRMATVQDRTHAVNGLNDPQQGACSGPGRRAVP